jgi:SAM-dependent methyltransferase
MSEITRRRSPRPPAASALSRLMEQYLAANRALWDEWTAIHEHSSFYDLEGFKRGGIRLREYELGELGEVNGKDLLHLQCHFGLDTLSFARLGAHPTGADFSADAISLARSLADELNFRAEFICSDLYNLPAALPGDFDIVYTSRGVLGWLPDIWAWAKVVRHFLRPGGVFYITEKHPFADVFDDDIPFKVNYDYFGGKEPHRFETQGSYADPEAHVEQPYEYGWWHPLSNIISALTSQGLRIDFLHEWPFCEWELAGLELNPEDGTWRQPGGEPRLPLFFSLRATKP